MNELEIAEKEFGLLDRLPLGVFVLREDYMVFFWNSQLEDWTGISRSEIVGTGLFAHFPHLNKPKYANRIREVFEGGPPTVFSAQLHKYIIPYRLPDGQLCNQQTTVMSLPGLDKREMYAIFAIQDVTDLTRCIQDYRTMRDKAVEEIQEQVLSKKALRIAKRQLKKYSLNLEKMVDERTKELKETLSDLQKTQSQLLQSEKMASLGQLAAGVAHEINNPIGFVSSNLKTLSNYQNDIFSLIREYRKLSADLKKPTASKEKPASISGNLDRIEELEREIDIDFILDDILDLIKESKEGTERIKKIVLDLKGFAHPGEDKLQTTDINKGIESTFNVVWNELKYKATITKEYGDLPQVQCYPQQLNQVFMNILVNAAQAIEKQGQIRIATRALDGQVEIAISDTGSGIPKKSLSKIFDPFFTTKEVGKGTGLGLNMAYNIIQKHKGNIEVESEEGKGTTFKIRIPIDK